MPPRPPIRLLPMGERALLLELPSLASVHAMNTALTERIERADPAGPGAPAIWWQVGELVPAERTILISLRPPLPNSPADLDGLAAALLDLATSVQTLGGQPDSPMTCEHEIPVAYDGPDLGQVATHAGLSIPEVIGAHTARPWLVGFGGFAPGFAYLLEGDPRLAVPRHATPRPSVPAGSVALAGRYCGIYPRRSPGGWRLIGHTDAVLWDLDRDPPALLCPGDRVRFVAVARS